jgi:hypothetical protein
MASLFQPGYLPSQTLAGKVFIGSTTQAGVTLAAVDATAPKFGLWNPAGSGKALVLVRITLGQTDATTPAISGLGLGVLTNAGSAIGATGAPITAFTETAPTSGLVGAPVGFHAGRFTLAATVVAPTFFYSLGFSQDSTTPGTQIDTCIHEFGGDMIVVPNTFICLGGANVAPGQDFAASIVWFEVDYPG